MTRRSELMLAYLSGFLLTFGIADIPATFRKPTRANSAERDRQELARHWRAVGDYIRSAKDGETAVPKKTA